VHIKKQCIILRHNIAVTSCKVQHLKMLYHTNEAIHKPRKTALTSGNPQVISTLIATFTEDMPSPVKTSGIPNKQTLHKTLSLVEYRFKLNAILPSPVEIHKSCATCKIYTTSCLRQFRKSSVIPKCKYCSKLLHWWNTKLEHTQN